MMYIGILILQQLSHKLYRYTCILTVTLNHVRILCQNFGQMLNDFEIDYV